MDSSKSDEGLFGINICSNGTLRVGCGVGGGVGKVVRRDRS